MTAQKPRALIIDDEPDLLSLLSISLERMGVDSVKAKNVKSAIRRLRDEDFDLCFTDLRLPDGNGLEVVSHIVKNGLNVPVAVITAFGDADTAVKALKSGAFDYVCKPIEIEALEGMVQSALRVNRAALSPLEACIIGTSAPGSGVDTGELIGSSDDISRIRTMISRVAQTQAPVHISGETGTGKELIARLIHEKSPRAGFPFVAVNCGAFPKELMESEFFGHKKGSFTGAVQETEGLFRAANGGTLFLDEVGELPLDLQVKLLRAIQEKKVRSVGGTQETMIDVRLISATNRNLAEMIEKAQFREDFYYRINVIPLHSPPLRNRTEDIPELVEHIVHRLNKQTRNSPVKISPDAIVKLRKYDYPGNIRELENILERTLALAYSDTIEARDVLLPERKRASQETDFSELSIDEHVMQVEYERILDALQESEGNVTAAAKLLGTTFRSLRYRIKKLGITLDS